MNTTIARISITAEPNGRAVWLQRNGGELKLIGCQLTEKEAYQVAKEMAMELGVTSGFSSFINEES